MTREHHEDDTSLDIVSLSTTNWIAIVTLCLLLITPLIALLWSHEVRITQREANAFSSQEANKLTISIAEQTLVVANLTSKVLDQNERLSKLQDQVSRLELVLQRFPNRE